MYVRCELIMLYSTVCIKIKVFHFQMPIVLKSIDLNICMWHIRFHWYPACIMYVTHDRVLCHWRWPCQFPLFASFANRIKALPNSAIVSLQRLSHLMPVDLEIWTKRCLQLFLVIWRIICPHLTWFTGSLGNYLAMLSRTSLSALCWNQRWICWRCWCRK